MDRVVVAERQGDRGCVTGSCIGGHIAMVIESVMQEREPTVGIRGSPGMGEVVAMWGACK